MKPGLWSLAAGLLIGLAATNTSTHAEGEPRLSPARLPERIAIQTEPAPSPAASLPAADLPPEVRATIESFLQSLIDGQVQSAYFRLLDGTSIGTQKEAMDRFMEATRESVDNYGPFTAFEPLPADQPTGNILLPTYMTTQKNKLLRWQFVFFRPSGSQWVLANLKVDDWRNFLALRLQPQATPPPGAVRNQLQEFFILLQSERIEDAFQRLLKDSPLLERADASAAFIERTRAALKEYGAIRQYELYDHRHLGLRIRLLTYFAYVDSEPLRWQFYYETSPNHEGWTLINVRVDDLLDEALLEL